MNASKTWSLSVVGFLAAFVAFNFIIWKAYTEDLLTDKKYYNGGLDRMGYIAGSKHYRNPENTLPRRVVENHEYRGGHVDVLTIGDSFSNVKKNGKDPMYQDWIASLYGLDVLNVQPVVDANVFATAIVLLNSGYLDEVRPRYLLLEFVERHCVDLFAKKADFARTMPLADIEALYRTASYKYKLPELGFINIGNFKLIQNAVLYRFSDNAYGSNVFVRELDRPFFSVRNDRKLLFYKDDLSGITNATPASLALLNDNLNRLADMLAGKGITLYFMPAADKYDIYSDYIVDNPYPKSVFFELLRPLPKKYVFIDTKAVLSGLVRNGMQDVYYADDTHWSWKAVKAIAERMQFPPERSVNRRAPAAKGAAQGRFPVLEGSRRAS